MTDILFVAYHFPPIGGAAVQRNARVARWLPTFGYRPIVVTGPAHDGRYRWTPLDSALAGELTEETEVHRLPGPEPARTGAWRGRLERWARVKTAWERWWTMNAVRVGRAVGAKADLIHCSLAPYQTAAAALRLSAELRKPLVVDLEDPWALDEMLVYPSGLHRRLELGRMRRVLRGADAIVMNTPESARRVLHSFPELDAKPVIAIPNGFQAHDFEGPVPEHDGGVFRIVHTGSLHTDMGKRQREASRLRRALGGAVPGIDFLTRSHVFLLDALHALVEERPELASRIEVHLAGVLTEDDLEVACRSPLVRVRGFLSHPETIALVRSADLLFLPMHDLPRGARVAIVPCKTYEYLASGRPILAAVPDGDAHDLLLETGAAHVCRPNDSEAMARITLAEYERWRRGERPRPLRDDVVARYEFRRLTGDLATFFDRVLARRPNERTLGRRSAADL